MQELQFQWLDVHVQQRESSVRYSQHHSFRTPADIAFDSYRYLKRKVHILASSTASAPADNKTGPKGSRAKVISELRETQRQTQLSTQRQTGETSPSSSTFGRSAGLLAAELIATCTDYYFAQLYGTMPILHRQSLADTVSQIDSSLEFLLSGHVSVWLHAHPTQPRIAVLGHRQSGLSSTVECRAWTSLDSRDVEREKSI